MARDDHPAAAARAVLARVFGHAGFRGPQEAIVTDVIAGHDVLAVMPTGAGKSLCYQLPALVRPGTGLVISPLIALMEGQVQAMCAQGVRAATLNSQSADSGDVWRALRAGAIDLLYVSPERALSPGFADMLANVTIALVAIDEAHCVSQWGHDFRPEYRRLKALCDALPGVPRVALTATADAETRADIARQLGIAPDRITVSGFDRPNIRYSVEGRDNLNRQLLAFLAGQQGAAGIVYAATRGQAMRIGEMLVDAGYRARVYHAGLEPEVRRRNARDFQAADDMVMVATIAFGMGIDKPDVRFVAHAGLPRSIEAYYQETGRAGRDGDPAVAHLIWGGDDLARLKRFIADVQDPQRRLVENRQLRDLVDFLETGSCRRNHLLRHFGESPTAPCGNCDICLNPPQLVEATEAARRLLSAVYRTGQRFGVAHLAAVLAGEANERVTSLGHDRTSVFGICRDWGGHWPKTAWAALARRLEAADALVRDADHGGLALGPAARPILKGEVPVMIRQPERRSSSRPDRGGGAAPPTLAQVQPADQALFEALRRLRRQLAQDAGVPPYVVFTDATLRAMAASRPRDAAGLARIPGVGTVKLQSWGQAFLAAIAGHA